MQTIPIIILNWNNASDTIDCLQSVYQQTYSDFHLYVIDNNSKESDRKALSDYVQGKPRLTFIENRENLGFGLAHNRVFEKEILPASFEYVVLLNNDTTVEPDWLERLIACAREEAADMVSCKMIQFDKRELINNLGHTFQNTGDILPIGNHEPESKYQKRFINAGASGGAALYSVPMLRRIGIFDPYFFCGYEDAELGLRAMIAGYKLIVEPRSIVYHKVSVAVDKVRNYDFTLKIQLDILYTYFTLMPLPVVLVNLPFMLLRNFILLLVCVAFGRFKYLQIFFHAWSLFFTREFPRVLAARRKNAPLRKLSSWAILRRQEFFLRDNVQRFYFYFIKGNKIVFERF